LKILVLYDTVSAKRNTEKVAMAISEVLKERAFDVDYLYVKNVDPAGVKNYECVFVGSPTQWRRATGLVMQFLGGFGKNEFSGKFAAAFDTRLQMPLSGNAASGIEKKLERLGFKIVMPSLATYVQSRKDVEGKNEIQLKDGELEKAKKYAEDLANILKQ
jgi:flavorubredoxin